MCQDLPFGLGLADLEEPQIGEGMFSWLKRLFFQQRSVNTGATSLTQPPFRSSDSDFLSRMMEAEASAWWKDKTSVVTDTDEQFAVVGPRPDATVEQLISLGKQLKQWQKTHGYARHIWGLDDLLEGQCPRTPPIYLMVPYPGDRFAECYEPVALVFVARGTNHSQALDSLGQALGEQESRLAWFTDPMDYSNWNR